MRNFLGNTFLALALSLGLMAFAPAYAGSAFLPDSSVSASVPQGYMMFCMQMPGECAAASGAASVTLTPDAWEQIRAVNAEVNNDIWPMDDRRHYGRAEVWTIPTDGYGDCDDYALTKRHILVAKGFPAAALRIAVVFTARGEKHAVLTVTTDRGDFVLDNQTGEILPWNQAGFFWVTRQSASAASGWSALNMQG